VPPAEAPQSSRRGLWPRRGLRRHGKDSPSAAGEGDSSRIPRRLKCPRAAQCAMRRARVVKRAGRGAGAAPASRRTTITKIIASGGGRSPVAQQWRLLAWSSEGSPPRGAFTVARAEPVPARACRTMRDASGAGGARGGGPDRAQPRLIDGEVTLCDNSECLA
jgi:hypothetical protein